MLVIKEENFEMVQSSKSGGPFFDLYLPTKINEGKINERTEMKLVGHGMPFEVCIKHLIGIKMKDEDGIYTIKEYIEKYKNVASEVFKLFQNLEWPKRTKKVEDGEFEE